MKKTFVAATLFLATALPAFAQFVGPRPSPKGSVMQTVGVTDVTVTYSRPGVKGRTIWGDLVPYDKVWRTGANAATIINFSRDVTFGGQPVKAGSYSIHTLPTPGAWKLFLNSEADPDGFYKYDATKNVLEIPVSPKAGPMTERMTISFPSVDDSTATLAIAWEKLVLEVPITTDTVNQVMTKAKAQLEDWRPAYQAATYAFENGRKADAAKWVEQSILAKETLGNLTLKAKILADAGKPVEAIAVGEKAVSVGKAAEADTSSTEKLVGEWKASAKGSKKK